MKISMHFTLPEEQEDFDAARLGRASLRFMQEFEDYIRKQIKYGSLAPETEQAYQTIRDEYYNLKKEYACE